MKFSILIVEKLPKHPMWNDSTYTADKSDAKKKCSDAMDQIEKIKETIEKLKQDDITKTFERTIEEPPPLNLIHPLQPSDFISTDNNISNSDVSLENYLTPVIKQDSSTIIQPTLPPKFTGEVIAILQPETTTAISTPSPQEKDSEKLSGEVPIEYKFSLLLSLAKSDPPPEEKGHDHSHFCKGLYPSISSIRAEQQMVTERRKMIEEEQEKKRQSEKMHAEKKSKQYYNNKRYYNKDNLNHNNCYYNKRINKQ